MFLVGIFDSDTKHFLVVARGDDLDEAVAEAEEATKHELQAIVFERYSKGYRVLWPKRLVLGEEVS